MRSAIKSRFQQKISFLKNYKIEFNGHKTIASES